MISKHTKIIGGIAGLVFLCSIAALAVLSYLINNANALLTEQKIQRERAETQRQELDSLVKLVEETTSEREELSNYLLSDDEVITFLALIETLGREQDVELKTNSLTVVDKNGFFEELQLQVSVDGSYDSVLHLLTLFETLPYQSFVSNVSLSRAVDEGFSNAWSGTFRLHVTKFKEL